MILYILIIIILLLLVYLLKLKHKYALKSGTTNSDNWNIGFNKNILCSVWVGYDNSDSLTTKDYKYAQNIWYNTVENY